MPDFFNALQQPIGAPVSGWQPRPYPQPVTLQGKYCRVEPLNSGHAPSLWQAWSGAPDDRGWTYLSTGPFSDEAQFSDFIATAAQSKDPLHYAIIDPQSGRALGSFALMRIDQQSGVIEVGHVMFSPLLQRSVEATEAHYLLMSYVFNDLGYRRYEWKCDSLNALSRQAALRLGFSYEGTFRQVQIYKGRTRDTAWFSLLDTEWPAAQAAFQAWLSPENQPQGVQKYSLATLRATLCRPHQARTRAAIEVRALQASDYTAWLALWQGYLTFYKTTLDDAITQITWQRLLSTSGPMFAFGAFDDQQKLLGIVHIIYHPATWSVTDRCYLEDLFTVPSARGTGVGRALIEAVYQHAQQRGSDRVYWHTHKTNSTAQALYDKLATNAGFIHYRKTF